MSELKISGDYLIYNNKQYNSSIFKEFLKAIIVTELTLEVHEDSSESKDKNILTLLADQGQIFTSPGLNGEIKPHVIKSIVLKLIFQETSKNTEIQEVKDFHFSAFLDNKVIIEELKNYQLLPDNRLNSTDVVLKSAFSEVKLKYFGFDKKIYIKSEDTNQQSEGFLSFLKSIGINIDYLVFELFRDYKQPSASFKYFTQIKLENSAIDLSIDFPLGGSASATVWTISLIEPLKISTGINAIFSLIHSLTKLDIAQLFVSQASGVSILDNFYLLKNFSLHQFNVFIDPQSLSISHVDFSIETDEPWEIIKDGILINALGFNGLINYSQGKPRFSCDFTGAFILSTDVELDIRLDVPAEIKEEDWALYLYGNANLTHFNELANLLLKTPQNALQLPQDFLTLKDLRLSVFQIEFNPFKQTITDIQVDSQLLGQLNILPGLALADPRFFMDIQHPFAKADDEEKRIIEGSLSGDLKIGSADFFLEANKLENGWRFTGNLEKSVTISGALNSIVTYFKLMPLPDYFSKFTFKELAFSYELSREETLEDYSPDSEVEIINEDEPKKSHQFDFIIASEFPLGEEARANTLDVLLKLHIANTAEDEHYYQISSQVILNLIQSNNTVKKLFFNAGLKSDSSKDRLLIAASYVDIDKAITLNLRDLIRAMVPSGTNIDFDLPIQLNYAALAVAKEKGEWGALLATQLGIGVNLSRLPLVGNLFTNEFDLRCVFQVIAQFGNVQFDIKDVNQLLPKLTTPIPELKNDENTNVLKCHANLTFGEFNINLDDVVDIKLEKKQKVVAKLPSQGVLQATTKGTELTLSDTKGITKWFKLQKSIGPLSFNRIGIRFDEGYLGFLLDANVSVAGMVLTLMGLGVKFEIANLSKSDLTPHFNLDGLGLSFQKGNLTISGQFLAQGENNYVGAATLKYSKLNLSALGAYTLINGHPSLFVYTVIDYPLGGPPCFFVTGLAAGFGYNRNLIIPKIEEVATFPLITEAITPPTTLPDPNEKLRQLNDFLVIKEGNYFFAVGVKFNSFKLIDAFLLLVMSVSERINIDLLGLAELVAPPINSVANTLSPIARIELALKGSFSPEEGIIEIRGQLTKNAYVFSPKAHLSGGFAFATWFSKEHKDDFALTVGGYHPSFDLKKYPHYPTVPPLALNWQVTEQLTIKADIYFALVPSAIMGGGHLQVNWQDGALKAWFNAGLDFLIAWQPVHYQAEVYVNIGGSYTFDFLGSMQTISIDVGANLQIWGPEFSGRAKIHLNVISFEIEFGAGTKELPKPLTWQEFSTAFLPSLDKEILKFAPSNGFINKKVNTSDNNEQWLINSKELEISIESVIPLLKLEKILALNKEYIEFEKGNFGVAPMDIASVNNSEVSISIYNKNSNVNDEIVTDQFEFAPIIKNVPRALWGSSITADIKQAPLLQNKVMGIRVKPKIPRLLSSDKGVSILGKQNIDIKIIDMNVRWENSDIINIEEISAEVRSDLLANINSQNTKEQRDKLLDTLGFSNKEVTVSADLAKYYAIPPSFVA